MLSKAKSDSLLHKNHGKATIICIYSYLGNLIKSQLVDTGLIHGCFYCMFGRNCEVQIRYLNQLPEDSMGRLNWGPGHTGEGKIKQTRDGDLPKTLYTHILAFE